MRDSYDEIKYPSLPRKQSHPAFIAALSAIAGLSLPPVDRWRVLEVGCGDGSNILPMAFDYPESRFIGLDRAVNPIEAGRALASRLRLANLELRVADLSEWEPEGEFDYIIAHGVFSWVPKEIREKILRICGASLKPHGIAFISYNVYPGCHFRRLAGDFLRFHVRRLTDPAARIQDARSLAQTVVDQMGGDSSPQHALCDEMKVILEKDAAVLYHDDLAEINEPFYLMDFLAQAARHDLQYLGDALPKRDDVRYLALQTEDWIESRQYSDFLVMRRFRESLLCRRDIALDRKLVFDRFHDLYVASGVKPAEPEQDGRQQFDLPKSGNVTTNNPLAKQILSRLSSLWPQSMRMSDISFEGFSPDSIPDLLMQLHQAGALEFRMHPPKVAPSVSDYPEASALARAQIAEGHRMVTNQRHINIDFQDETIRKVVSLLDGSRNRQELARDLVTAGLDPETIHKTVEYALSGLHRLNLLTA
ncbi:MAG: class I SAM-dependent methyltransferase [Acidobacteria bacterium]|nr:class I SAM-dependent methyltransferase [Acidobacteriota bacterium]